MPTAHTGDHIRDIYFKTAVFSRFRSESKSKSSSYSVLSLDEGVRVKLNISL